MVLWCLHCLMVTPVLFLGHPFSSIMRKRRTAETPVKYASSWREREKTIKLVNKKKNIRTDSTRIIKVKKQEKSSSS